MRHEDSPPAARVAQLASSQHGVVSHGQLVAAGLSNSQVARWVRAGHIHRLHRGVFAVGHRNVRREGRYLAAVLAAGHGAALSHSPAARHLRLDLSSGVGTIHVSIPRVARRRVAGVLVHRPRRLDPCDVVTRDRIPATSPTRTLFDLSPLRSPSQLRGLFERAEYMEVLERDRLRQLLEQSSGHGGAATLRELLGYQPLPLSRIRGGLERILLTTCREHSLPLPAVNVPVLDYEVDFFWPAARFIVEADGGRHVGERRDADNARDLALQRAGYLVRRYGEGPLENPPAIAAEITAILRERLPRGATSARPAA